MFSLSQYIIIGLVGSIYVAGTALLLAGRSFLQNSGSPFDAWEQQRTESSGALEGAPFFVPVFEVVAIESVVPEGSRSLVGGEQVRDVRGDRSLDHRIAEHEGETGELLLLAEPICLN